MFLVTVPATRKAEHEYIVKTILGDFLGLSHEIRESGTARYVSITRSGDSSGRRISVATNLLTQKANWLKPESLPELPLLAYGPPSQLGYAAEHMVPAMFGPTDAIAESKDGSLGISFDLFGSAFFLLSRYEEVALDCRGPYGWFPAAESIACKGGVIERPLVDEYSELLRRAMAYCWPETKFKERRFKIVPTHDVDFPYEFLFWPAWRVARRSAARLLLQRNPAQAAATVRNWRAVRAGSDEADSFYKNLLGMMELNEKAGLQGRFYFIAGHTAPQDTDYAIEHPRIRRLLRLIHERGHLVGLHPSFGTLGKPELLKEEFARLKTVCEEEGISQQTWSVRSHFLRWDSRHSFRDFDGLGFDFDSTLAFADRVGFRCGTCHEFTTFDLASSTALRMREQPLIAMECTVVQPYRPGTDFESVANLFRELRRQCRAVGGQFVFLWHNSRFPTSEDWELYRQQVFDV